VAQFRAFVESAGVQVRDPKCLRDVLNHPVKWVSFHEAQAYCNWLAIALQEAEWTPSLLRERLANGWVITLPSEAEWEKAARGTDARIYPWGNEFDAAKANCRDHGLSTTTAVGLFREGVSPVGCLDMSGNVREWTRSNSEMRYPYIVGERMREAPGPGEESDRVLRGGGFDSGEYGVRATYRFRSEPGFLYENVGFRVVFHCPRPDR
jgi:formylglycine-generating enzyme required for sulfatase activity